MPKKSHSYYSVYDRKSGALIITGNSIECSKALNIRYNSFLTLCAKSKQIPNPTRYRIVRLNPRRTKKDIVAQRPEYPCKGCINRVYCDYTGEYCNAFAVWFSYMYDDATEQLKSLTQAKGCEL